MGDEAAGFSGDVGLGSLEQDAGLESSAGTDQGHRVGAGDRAPAGLGGLDQLERHGQGRGRAAGTRVTLVRSLTVEKVDSMGFVVRRWTKCSAGKS